MLIQEIVTVDNRQLKHSYSTDGTYILQIETGRLYVDAYDTMKANYTYKATDIVVPEEDKEILI